MVTCVNNNNNIGLVIGATKKEEIRKIREIAPSLTWLVPGIGTQGGDLEESVKNRLLKLKPRDYIGLAKKITLKKN